MATTPEGKIKDAVKKVLNEFKEMVPFVPGKSYKPALYAHWPVQNGMGSPTLDCIGCYYGVYFAIETKAPGKKPTPRQEVTIEQIKCAGGIVFVIDGEDGIDGLRQALHMIRWSHANNSQPQA